MKLENRQKLVQALIKKSQTSLGAAIALSEDGFTEAAISRAYYAAFCSPVHSIDPSSLEPARALLGLFDFSYSPKIF